MRSTAAVGPMEDEPNTRKSSMSSSEIQNTRRANLERAIQEPSSIWLWIVFHAVAAWSVVGYSLRFKRVCAWHRPKQKRMGGNPFARRVTHGICPDCFARVSAEIISHGETILRVSVTKDGQQGEASLPAPPARNCAVPAWLQWPSAGDMDTTRPAVLRGKNQFQ